MKHSVSRAMYWNRTLRNMYTALACMTLAVVFAFLVAGSVLFPLSLIGFFVFWAMGITFFLIGSRNRRRAEGE